MDYYPIIAGHFQDTLEAVALSVDTLATPIERASLAMTNALLADHKIVACGHGPDGLLAQLLVEHLLDNPEQERPALPALALRTGNSAMSEGNTHFSRQLRALGQAGDILFCVSSTPSYEDTLLQAVRTAGDRSMTVVVLSCDQGTALDALLGPEDIHIKMNTLRRSTILEMHTMVIHSLCKLIDLNIFGGLSQG